MDVSQLWHRSTANSQPPTPTPSTSGSGTQCGLCRADAVLGGKLGPGAFPRPCKDAASPLPLRRLLSATRRGNALVMTSQGDSLGRPEQVQVGPAQRKPVHTQAQATLHEGPVCLDPRSTCVCPQGRPCMGPGEQPGA